MLAFNGAVLVIVVLLDTAVPRSRTATTMPKTRTRYAAAAQALRPLLETARELDVTIIALHHARARWLGQGRAKKSLGSTKIAGSSRCDSLAIETEEDGEDPNGRSHRSSSANGIAAGRAAQPHVSGP